MSAKAERFAPAVHAGLKEKERMQRLRRAQRSLWFLATEILDRHWLSPEYHKPMLDDMDRRTSLRRDGRYDMDELEMWPRAFCKTTVRQVQTVQDLLWNPAARIIWWHAVDQQAIDSVAEIGRMFMYSEELRKLCPEMMPTKQNKRFATSLGFRLKANKSKDMTCRGFGQETEATGVHAEIAYPDDIIGSKTVADSAMPRVRNWFGTSVRNIITARSCKAFPDGTVKFSGVIRASGTHWDINDIYTDWRSDKAWDCRIRAAYEKDGEPDEAGEPMFLTREQLEAKRAGMTSWEWSCQMMNTPLPPSERSWQPEYEREIAMSEIKDLPKAVFVLSDPAPMHVGGLTGDGERQRADGSKDDWAIAVVAWCVKAQRRFAVLLDGAFSSQWTTSEGMDQCCRFMTRWNTPHVGIECYGGLGIDYRDKMLEAVKRNGNRHHHWIEFKNSYAKNAKKLRFEDLYDLCKQDRFYVADTCDQGFKAKFYDQNRQTRWLPNGRNASPYDDVADSVSRCTDRAVLDIAPTEQASSLPPPWETEDPYVRRSRYLNV